MEVNPLAPRPDFNIYIGGFYLKQRFDLVDGRHRWTHLPGIAVAALAMMSASLTFAAEPWSADTNPLAWVPLALATALLLAAADLMLRPKPPWVRFRDNSVIYAGWIALLGTLVFAVLTDGALAWPTLFPLFVFPMALPAFTFLGLAPASRLIIDDRTWRRTILICLALGLLLLLVAAYPYQHQIATSWSHA
jgi:hypothetical protein